MVNFSNLISMTYLKQWNKKFSVVSRIFPPQKAARFFLWNAFPLYIHFIPMILGSLIFTRYIMEKIDKKFFPCFMLGNTQGAGCSWNQHPFGFALNRRLLKTPAPWVLPYTKSNLIYNYNSGVRPSVRLDSSAF